MEIVFSEDCLKFGMKGHPESPERVKSASDFLKSRGYKFVKPKEALEEEILKVHTKELVETVKSNKFFDFDTPNYPDIYRYASLSAGAAITALEKEAFSLMRPPGHHAGKNFLGGFCYFNNIAIAIKNGAPDKKVLIVDIDGHHGNGTEDIFLGEKSVVYLSLHRSPYYPGTGLKSFGNVINKPLSYSSGNYVETLEEGLKEAKKIMKPDLVAVSAGFDTLDGDLASLGLSVETYKKIGELISKLEKPTFAVLEGGYSRYLGECVDNFILGLLG